MQYRSNLSSGSVSESVSGSSSDAVSESVSGSSSDAVSGSFAASVSESFSGSSRNERIVIQAIYLLLLIVHLLSTSAETSARGTDGPEGTLTSQNNTLLFFNEIMASNGSTIEDEDGDRPDWIELYYSGNKPISLHLFGLSDDPDEPFKWMFPDTTIHPGEYLLVWASGKDRATAGEPLHTCFRIAMAGDDLILSHPAEGILDTFSARTVPTDISVGRVPDGYGDWYYFKEPTPGFANTTEAYLGLNEPVTFSHPPGFYEAPFELVLEPQDEQTVIHYTLDGSEPDRNAPVYSGPITVYDRTQHPNVFSTIRTSFRTFDWRRWYEPEEPVTKATVLRVMTHKEGNIPAYSKKTFFVLPEGDERYDVPVISIATDSLHLFDHETGIYIPGIHYSGGGTGNYHQRGEEWEREATFELFESDGDRVLNQNIGIRIHGGFSRELAQKSLRLYARNRYGESRFEHQFFGETDDDSFNRLILRNAGNTWGEDMFMDALAQSLVRHFNVDTQAYRPAVLFLNGEFWGIHNIRERYDKHYLERVYGVDPENIDLLTRNQDIKEGDNHHYQQMISFVTENDLGDNAVFDEAATMIDIDNYLDYYSAQTYYGNNDWPHNNIDFWRARVPFDPEAPAGRDGRWRWLLFDVDRSIGHETGPEFDMIAWITQPLIRNEEWANLLFRNLLENEQFKYDFVNRVADHLNSAFRPERVAQVIDSLSGPVESLISEHIERWSLPQNMTVWQGFLDEMYRYAEERPQYLRGHIVNHFGLPGVHPVILDVTDPQSGFIRVNSLDVIPSTPGIPHEPWPWTGIYFEDIPVTLKAVSKPGHSFEGWQVDGHTDLADEPTLTIHPGVQKEIKALFSTPSTAETEETPNRFALHQNHPNPFNASTTISFDLPERSEVRLEIFDVLGRQVAELAHQMLEPGRHQFAWDASTHATGVYIVRMEVSGGSGLTLHSSARSMLLIR